MIELLVRFGGLLVVGSFFLVADMLCLPYLKTLETIVNTRRESRKAAEGLEMYLFPLATKLAPYIRMDGCKRGW